MKETTLENYLEYTKQRINDLHVSIPMEDVKNFLIRVKECIVGSDMISAKNVKCRFNYNGGINVATKWDVETIGSFCSLSVVEKEIEHLKRIGSYLLDIVDTDRLIEVVHDFVDMCERQYGDSPANAITAYRLTEDSTYLKMKVETKREFENPKMPESVPDSPEPIDIVDMRSFSTESIVLGFTDEDFDEDTDDFDEDINED